MKTYEKCREPGSQYIHNYRNTHIQWPPSQIMRVFKHVTRNMHDSALQFHNKDGIKGEKTRKTENTNSIKITYHDP